MGDEPLAEAEVLVTGGSGFIGTYLCEELQKASAKVFNLDTRAPVAKSSFHIEGRGTDVEKLKTLVKSKSVVFHLSGNADVRRSFHNPEIVTSENVVGTLNVLECIRRYNDDVLLQLVSTSAVYGSVGARTKREDAPIAPLSPYAASKASTEIYARMYSRKYGLKIVIFRPFNTYGAFHSPRKDVVSEFVATVLGGRQPVVNGSGDQIRDLTYVADTVRIMAATVGKKAAIGKILNIGTGAGVKIRDLASLVIQAYSRDAKMMPIFDLEADPGPPGNICDTTLLNETVGDYPRTNIQEGLRMMRSTIFHAQPL